MEILAHFGARPSHAVWQGKVFSLSGNSSYPNFYTETEYGTGDGLGGWNCRHSFSPFFEGLSKIPQQYDITKSNEIYEKQQKQRRLERNIRNRKREIEGLKSSIESTTDIKAKAELQKELDIAKSKLKVQSRQYKQYCEDNHFKTQNERLRIAKTSQNGLTSEKDSANIKSIATRIIGSIQKPIKPTNIYEYGREPSRLMHQLSGLGLNVNFKSFNGFDKQLLFENVQRLNDLIERYPIAKNYIAKNKVGFDGIIDKTHTIGMCTRNIFNDRVQDIHLNKDHFISYYERTRKQIEASKNCEKMPLSKEYASVYTITHEFGHFIENILIGNYNKEHLEEYTQIISKAKFCADKKQGKKIMHDWYDKQAYNIKLAILDYVSEIDNSSFMNYEIYISQYGNKNPQEFFAECFANLHCGQPNILGLAMEKYLKEVLKNDY